MAEVKTAALVLTDISGYTRFIKHRQISLLHAEQIITDLLESIAANAEFPLTISKFEGDAAFLYAVADGPAEAVAKDVLRQTTTFATAFKQKQQELVAASQCPCDAHTHIAALRLKSILHFGEVVFKQIRQFDELAGEAVILIHRLLKNSAVGHEYVLLTERFQQLSGGLDSQPQRVTEQPADFGPTVVYIYYPGGQVPSSAVLPAPPRSFFGGLLTRLRGG